MRWRAPLALGVGLPFGSVGPLLTGGDAEDEAIKNDRKKYEGHECEVVGWIGQGEEDGHGNVPALGGPRSGWRKSRS